MAQMKRNVNLEEIETDALFGLEQLKYQTITQKIIFFACLFLSIAENIVLPYIAPGIPSSGRIAIFIILLGIGVTFGCNYNQDMSLFRYAVYTFSKKSAYLKSISTEDVNYLKEKAASIKAREDELLKKKQEYDRTESVRRLKKLIFFLIIILIVIISMYFVINVLNNNPNNMHHTVG